MKIPLLVSHVEPETVIVNLLCGVNILLYIITFLNQIFNFIELISHQFTSATFNVYPLFALLLFITHYFGIYFQRMYALTSITKF